MFYIWLSMCIMERRPKASNNTRFDFCMPLLESIKIHELDSSISPVLYIYLIYIYMCVCVCVCYCVILFCPAWLFSVGTKQQLMIENFPTHEIMCLINHGNCVIQFSMVYIRCQIWWALCVWMNKSTDCLPFPFAQCSLCIVKYCNLTKRVLSDLLLRYLDKQSWSSPW